MLTLNRFLRILSVSTLMPGFFMAMAIFLSCAKGLVVSLPVNDQGSSHQSNSDQAVSLEGVPLAAIPEFRNEYGYRSFDNRLGLIASAFDLELGDIALATFRNNRRRLGGYDFSQDTPEVDLPSPSIHSTWILSAVEFCDHDAIRSARYSSSSSFSEFAKNLGDDLHHLRNLRF